MANIFEVSKKNEIWFIDSACSNHITGNNNIFANLGRNFKSQVEIGNGEFLKICGRGTVEMETVKENKRWNWIFKEIELSNDLRIVDDNETAPAELINEEYVDHLPVRGTISLQEIYQRCHVAMIEPSSFDEAFKYDNWRKAMQIELEMIKKNKTWQLVQRPTYHKVIGVKWIFRTKVNPDGTVNKLNAQLVVKDVYIEQPQGFTEPAKEDMVYKLNKALYGLKQAPRAWYGRIDSYLCKKGFIRSDNEPTLMNECKPASTPLAANLQLTKKDGSGAADATYYKTSRPEIMFSASLMSKFMQSPTMNHLSATKRILRYIKGSIDYGIKIGGFSWHSKKQEVVALSSAEAEYISTSSAANQAIWLRKILLDLGKPQLNPTVLWIDNQSTMALAKNPIQHARTKHIRVKYHSIREAVKNLDIEVYYCCSNEQYAYIMTKSLSNDQFISMRSNLGVTKLNLKNGCFPPNDFEKARDPTMTKPFLKKMEHP
ncbi:Reverse transcriptase [Theobroma cacao]|nr:Reverse transcriptase [Theobroma cacao]